MLVCWNVRRDCFLLPLENLLLTEQDMPFWITDNNRDNLFFQKKLRVVFTVWPARALQGVRQVFSVLLGSSSSPEESCLRQSEYLTRLVWLVLTRGMIRQWRLVTMGPLVTLAPSQIPTCWLFPRLLLTFLSSQCWHVSCSCLNREIVSARWWKSEVLALWPLLAPSRGGDSCVFVAWLRAHSRGSISSLVSVLIPATKTELFTSRLTPVLVISSAVLSPLRSIHLIMWLYPFDSVSPFLVSLLTF